VDNCRVEQAVDLALLDLLVRRVLLLVPLLVDAGGESLWRFLDWKIAARQGHDHVGFSSHFQSEAVVAAVSSSRLGRYCLGLCKCWFQAALATTNSSPCAPKWWWEWGKRQC